MDSHHFSSRRRHTRWNCDWSSDVCSSDLSWLLTKPRWFIPVGVYIYTGFLPLPGEFLMVLLALLGISFKRVLIPTLLGNFTLALIVSSSAVYGLAFADLIF